jgi:hypothetical protein
VKCRDGRSATADLMYYRLSLCVGKENVSFRVKNDSLGLSQLVQKLLDSFIRPEIPRPCDNYVINHILKYADAGPRQNPIWGDRHLTNGLHYVFNIFASVINIWKS